MEKIILNNIERADGIIKYNYSYPEWVTKYMKADRLFVSLPDSYDINIIPDAILTIPFVGVMIGVAIVLGLQIEVDELESEYCESIKRIEKAFATLYSNANVKCEVIVHNPIECASYNKGGDKASVFFTGGLDATSALADIVDHKPILINIWGADVELEDDATHYQLEDYFKRICNKLEGTEYCFVKSNCRELFYETELDKVFRKRAGRKAYLSYWESMGDICAMTAVMAPLVWHKGIQRHYIGSDYVEDLGAAAGNSNIVVESIAYCGCRFVPADSKLDRNQKAKKVSIFKQDYNVPLELKVCWHRIAGKNCSACEKCYRTMLNIAVNYEDPSEYGFYMDANTFKKIRKYLQTHKVNKKIWSSIMQRIKEDPELSNKNPNFLFLKNININTPLAYGFTIIRKIIGILKRKLQKT